MNRTIANTLGIVSICAVCLIGWAAWRLGVMADGVKVPDMTASVAKLNQTLDIVSRPCASVDASGHLLPDGPICEMDDAIHDIRKITTASGKQVQQTGLLIAATTENMNAVGQSVQQTATALTSTAAAATGTLQEGQRTLAAFQPVLGHADATVTDLDAALKSNATEFHGTLVDFHAMAGSGAGILADGRTVADKMTADYTKAHTPWGAFRQKLSDSYDILALGARHIP